MTLTKYWGREIESDAASPYMQPADHGYTAVYLATEVEALLRAEHRRIVKLVQRLREGRMSRTGFQKSRRNDGLPERAYSLACDDLLKALKESR